MPSTAGGNAREHGGPLRQAQGRLSTSQCEPKRLAFAALRMTLVKDLFLCQQFSCVAEFWAGRASAVADLQ
jgi:hypothetical protein